MTRFEKHSGFSPHKVGEREHGWKCLSRWQRASKAGCDVVSGFGPGASTSGFAAGSLPTCCLYGQRQTRRPASSALLRSEFDTKLPLAVAEDQSRTDVGTATACPNRASGPIWPETGFDGSGKFCKTRGGGIVFDETARVACEGDTDRNTDNANRS